MRCISPSAWKPVNLSAGAVFDRHSRRGFGLTPRRRGSSPAVEESDVLLDQVERVVAFVDAIQTRTAPLAGWALLAWSKPLPKADALHQEPFLH